MPNVSVAWWPAAITWMPELAGGRRHALGGLARQERLGAGRGGLLRVVRAGARDDREALDACRGRRRGGAARGSVTSATLGDELRSVEAAVRQRREEADRLAAVGAEGLHVLGAEGVGEQGVVAELGVGVEGEVVGGQRDVRVEEKLQAALARVSSIVRTPEPQKRPWWTSRRSACCCCRALEELGVGRHARRELGYLRRAGDLQAVHAVVLEAGRFEQAVGLGEDVGDGGGHGATITGRRPARGLPRDQWIASTSGSKPPAGGDAKNRQLVSSVPFAGH